MPKDECAKSTVRIMANMRMVFAMIPRPAFAMIRTVDFFLTSLCPGPYGFHYKNEPHRNFCKFLQGSFCYI